MSFLGKRMEEQLVRDQRRQDIRHEAEKKLKHAKKLMQIAKERGELEDEIIRYAQDNPRFLANLRELTAKT